MVGAAGEAAAVVAARSAAVAAARSMADGADSAGASTAIARLSPTIPTSHDSRR